VTNTYHLIILKLHFI